MTVPPRRRAGRTLVSATTAALLATAGIAHADDDRTLGASPTPPPAATASTSASDRAEKLFHEGEELFDARSFTEACAKFAANHDLDPKLGTLLNLAFCHESEGRTARARAEFDEALMWAVQKGQRDREQFAREHLASLEKRLSYLVLEGPASESGPVDVRVDGQPVPRSRWGAPLVVDPGLHMLTTTSPGKEPQPLLFYVEPGPATRMMRIPTLLDDPVAAAKLARHAAPPPVSGAVTELTPAARTRRTAGLVSLGTGAVATVVGAYFTVRALSSAGDVRSRCGGPRGCDDTVPSSDRKGGAYTAVAGVALGVGLIGLGVGSWLVLSTTRGASSRPVVRAALVPHVTWNGGGASIAGTF